MTHAQTAASQGYVLGANEGEHLVHFVSRGRMEGFIILDYAARFPEAIGALAGWLKEGKLKQKEDVAIGLENAPDPLSAFSPVRISESNC